MKISLGVSGVPEAAQPGGAQPGGSELDPAAGSDLLSGADESTRERVAKSILEHGPSTAAALAERLGLTPAAVRRHLDVLVARGHLVPREQRTYGARGRGRPAKVFALTDAGRAGFYAAYDELAVELLEYLATEVGPDAVTKFAATRLAEMETRYAEQLAAAPKDSNPAEVLAAALTSDGFVASASPLTVGPVVADQLCQHHCPVAHVAERFPQLCEAETEAFARLVGGHVQRLATIAHGDGVCTTHIPRAVHQAPSSGGHQTPSASSSNPTAAK